MKLPIYSSFTDKNGNKYAFDNYADFAKFWLNLTRATAKEYFPNEFTALQNAAVNSREARKPLILVILFLIIGFSIPSSAQMAIDSVEVDSEVYVSDVVSFPYGQISTFNAYDLEDVTLEKDTLVGFIFHPFEKFEVRMEIEGSTMFVNPSETLQIWVDSLGVIQEVHVIEENKYYFKK